MNRMDLYLMVDKKQRRLLRKLPLLLLMDSIRGWLNGKKNP